MRKKLSRDWLSILLISVFSFNTILYIFLYLSEKDIHNLIFLILYLTCLLIYVLVLILSKLHCQCKYIIVYNDFFEIYGKNIFDSKIVVECKNRKYVKYGLSSTKETKYEFSYNNFVMNFGTLNIDENRKLMIIYKVKNTKDDSYEEFFSSMKKSVEYYCENNDLVPLKGDNIFYKNKRNAFEIKEVNGKFIVLKYRYYVPVDVNNIKQILVYKPGWNYIGDSHDDGLELFETYEKAIEYISYLM